MTETSANLLKRTFDSLRRNRNPILLTILCFLFAILFLYFFYVHRMTGIGAEQPIPYSHRLHSGVKQIQCEFCHPYVGRSHHPGIPAVEKCLYCHKYIIANHPEIRKEHQYYNTNTPTPWRKVNYLAEHVVFNHKRHVRKNVACRECHGAVETMDRIKGVHFKMGFCVDCHRAKEANLGCWLACHN
jgi:hypothetical protein